METYVIPLLVVATFIRLYPLEFHYIITTFTLVGLTAELYCAYQMFQLRQHLTTIIVKVIATLLLFYMMYPWFEELKFLSRLGRALNTTDGTAEPLIQQLMK